MAYDEPVRHDFLRPALERVERRLFRPCLRCGHRALDHRPQAREIVSVTADGAIENTEYRLGPCSWMEGPMFCPCSEYVPDELSRVTEMLGLDVRRVVGA